MSPLDALWANAWAATLQPPFTSFSVPFMRMPATMKRHSFTSSRAFARTPTCPKCGSVRVFDGAYSDGRVFLCLDCDHDWAKPEPPPFIDPERAVEAPPKIEVKNESPIVAKKIGCARM